MYFSAITLPKTFLPLVGWRRVGNYDEPVSPTRDSGSSGGGSSAAGINAMLVVMPPTAGQTLIYMMLLLP